MSVVPGGRIGPYEIVALLGRGGMGSVFLAYDTNLHRRVALKVLTESGDDELSRAHLLREARNAAALSHPNICVVHEVNAAGGTAFISMEYVEGRSLRDRLDEGALSLDETADYGRQAADALAYAHDHGVVHRDFKAGNAIVTSDGRLKIVDFGLARRGDAMISRATTMASIVPAGTAAGTPYAMAPEQVRGEPADARTDVWALGVLLYEMASGATPFKAPTTPDLFSAILRDAPPPLPDAVLPPLRAVIERCLEKDRDRRWQHAREVHVALGAIAAGTAPPGDGPRRRAKRRGWRLAAVALLAIASAAIGFDVAGVRTRLVGRPQPPARIRLAVLPFANLTGDPEQEFFSDGLTEEMITQLGRLQPQRLSVVARTSSMRYKNRETPVDQIGRELGVDYVLEGSARREGTRIRISATLVQVRDQTQRWSDSFERELASILSLQNDVARGVAGSLALALLPAEQARLASARPVNPEAYENYLKGQVYLWKLTPQALDTAQEYFQLALKKDPNYAVAQLGMAAVWASRTNILDLSPDEGWPKEKAAALRVLELDDGIAEAHSHLGTVLAWYEWKWTDAEREIRRALDINPNLADAHRLHALILASTGRREEGLAAIRRAVALDPQSPLWQLNQGVLLFSVGREDEAIAMWQKLAKTSPDFTLTYQFLWDAFNKREMFDDAVTAAKMFHAGRGDTEAAESLARGYSEGGYRRAMHAAADMMTSRFARHYVHPTAIARLYAYAGERDKAIEWLENACDGRDSQLMYLAWHMEWDSLRADPRVQALLRRMNLPAS
jgi:eukaryotic-like serine/threonine-protein kinase